MQYATLMIPVNEPFVGEQEIANVLDALRTGWISSAGRYIDEFEQAWAAYCGKRYGVAVSNGTVALEAAVCPLVVRANSERNPPPKTWFAPSARRLHQEPSRQG